MESFDNEMLLKQYLSSFSRVYDPHSDYLSPSNVEDFDINMKLSLVGIGAMLSNVDDGAAKIERLISGSLLKKMDDLNLGIKLSQLLKAIANLKTFYIGRYTKLYA